jgi:excisionase family DNA binding protein
MTTPLHILALHAAVMIRDYRAGCQRHGWACPPELAALEQLALQLVKSAQERAGARTDSPIETTRSYPRKMLTVNEYAQAMDVDPSTVRRWVKAGRVPVVRVGRTVRIPAAALETTNQKETT